MEFDFVDTDRYYIVKQIKQSRHENQLVIADKKTDEHELLYFWFHNHTKYQDFCPKLQAYSRAEDLSALIPIMKHLNHPLILQIKDYEIMNSNFLIGCILKTEFPVNGCLSKLTSEYLQTSGKKNLKMNPTIRSKIIFGIASLMSYLHSKNIVNTNLSLECVYLDENFEPKILNDCLSKSSKLIHRICHNQKTVILNRDIEKDPLYYKPLFDKNCDDNDLLEEKLADVYSFGLFVNSLFSTNFDSAEIKSELMPNCYWKLVSKCLSQQFGKCPNFDEIVENLQNDEFAIEEFGMKTDIEQLHEYQKRLLKFRELDESEHGLHLPKQRRIFGCDNDYDNNNKIVFDDDDDDKIIIEF